MNSREQMQAEFVAQGGEKRDPKQEAATRKRNLGRQQPIKARSIKQKMLDAKWAGIKEDRIYMMGLLDADGAHCEECGVPGDAETLDLDHLRPRGAGGEYGARNAGLKCNYKHPAGNDCHGAKHGQPQWSGADDDRR